jgi:8-oxo-dGTP diphosphatase
MENHFRFKKDWPYHVSAGVVVIDNDKVAILYRSKERFGVDSWHLPKGTLEDNETIEHAAVREAKEESGLDVKLEGYLGAIQQSWKTKQTGTVIDKVTHYFLAKKINDTGKIDDEHDSLIWLEIQDAKQKLGLGPKKEEVIIDRAIKFKEMFL